MSTGRFVATVFYSVELSHAVIFNHERLHFHEYLSVNCYNFIWKTCVIRRFDIFLDNLNCMESGYSLNKEMANRKVSVVELQGGKSAGQMFYF